eukprot:758974-Hanusia_phi.AAC.5
MMQQLYSMAFDNTPGIIYSFLFRSTGRFKYRAGDINSKDLDRRRFLTLLTVTHGRCSLR